MELLRLIDKKHENKEVLYVYCIKLLKIEK